MSSVLYIFITSMFTANVCVGSGFALPSLVAHKRSFPYTAIMCGIFAGILILSGCLYYVIYNFVLLPNDAQFLSLMLLVILIGVFSFVAHFSIMAIHKEAFYVYEKSYTFLYMFVSVLGVLLSVTADQPFGNYFLTLLFSSLGFLFINFFVYGAYYKINGTYAPKYMKGLPLLLIVLSIIGMVFTTFGFLL